MKEPDYHHRTYVGLSEKAEDFNDTDLIDCISISVEQAEASILQMQTQYMTDQPKILEGVNWYTLEVIRKEMMDIKTLVQWYFKEVKNEQ